MEITTPPADDCPDISAMPVLHNLVEEIHRNTGASKYMILMSILAIGSHAAQTLYKVKAASMPLARISLFIWVIANSGMMKSRVFELLIRSLVQHQAGNYKKFQIAMEKFASELEVWKLQKKEIKRKISKALKDGKEIALLQEALEQHNCAMPAAPRLLIALHNDSTDAVILNPEGNHISLMIASSEASSITESASIKRLIAWLCESWSNSASFSRNRKGTGWFDAAAVHASMLIMIQEGGFFRFDEKCGDIARDKGVYPRTLFCIPADNRGHRTPPPANPEWPCLNQFHEHMTELYSRSDLQMTDPDFKEVILEITPESAELLGRLRQHTEIRLADRKMPTDIKVAASRSCEHLPKLASVLHLLERRTGCIEMDCMEVALRIYKRSMEDYRHITDPATNVTRAALQLELYFERKLAEGRRYLEYDDLRFQANPKSLRKAETHKPAMQKLIEEGKVKLFKYGSGLCIDLDPDKMFDYAEARRVLCQKTGKWADVHYPRNGEEYSLPGLGVLPNTGDRPSPFTSSTGMPMPAISGFGRCPRLDDDIEQETVPNLFDF